MGLTLEQAIARVPQWHGAKDMKISPLGGGITNQNYKVETGGEAYVLRIAGANTELLGINREFEYAANLKAGELGIAPEVVYFIQPEGYLVTRFIAGRPLSKEEISQPETIKLVVETLKEIHAMPPIPGSFSAFRTVENYEQIARRYQVPFPQQFPWLLEKMQQVELAMKKHSATSRPCHNDLLNENFIYDGRVRILDWEYAGMGDIFFDLANFSVNHTFSDDQDKWLLECYFGKLTFALLARLKVMKIMSDFREAMWGMVQIGISKLEVDFIGYADKHFMRMTENINNSPWEQWLKEIEKNG